MQRLYAVLVAFAVLFSCGVLRAQTCDARVRAWAAACPELRAECAEPLLCPPGRAIVRVGCSDAARLDVELGRATPSTFRRVGELGLAPVGEFQNFASEPPERRAAFESVARCAARSGSPLEVSELSTLARALLPWRFLAGMLLGGALLGSLARARSRRTLLRLAGACVLTAIARALLVPAEFFHQNGQGPSWIATALDSAGGASHYGPGYWELFHALVRLRPDAPEAVVFGAQAALGALVPALAFAVARSAGASRAFAWVSLAAVASSPLLARVFQSESYYAINGFCLWFSAALLATAARYGSVRVLGVASLAAGLVIAQATRTLPIACSAAALLPLVVLLVSSHDRVKLAAGSAAIVAVVVLASTGTELFTVLRGYLGDAWLPKAREQAVAFPRSIAVATPVALALLALLALAKARRRALPAALTLVVTVAAADLTCLVRDELPTVVHAYLWLFAPSVLIALAALERELSLAPPRRIAMAWSFGAVLGLLHAVTAARDLTLPTDAEELGWMRRLRARLEPDALVLYLGQTERGVLDLPLYALHPHSPRAQSLVAHQAPPPISPGMKAYYYRSSLCSTGEGRASCETLERVYQLERLEERTLEAKPSHPALPYLSTEIRVGLYRASAK